MKLLEIENLFVEINGKKVLNGVNLNIEEGEVHILMGPNGSGKSSLIMSLLGYPHYKIVKGKLKLAGEELNLKPIYERVKLGLAISFQSPPEIRGVKLRDLIRLSAGEPVWKGGKEEVATSFLQKVGLPPELFCQRDVNVGFSGGERKRSELAQVFAQKPKLMVLDEVDSGVDIDSLKMIGRDLSEYIQENHCACLVVTHYRHILSYLKPDFAHIMCGGVIVKSGEPFEMFTRLEERGYCEYLGLCPPGIKDKIEKEIMEKKVIEKEIIEKEMKR
ncbi:Fe-S cluster assembly ATPase SufC [bacterium]|nr:Fe-S cluster assembly ATPase SufC [bacterium]MBU0899230.1 Fe-S cluster assembly ATPase SufC [bacterium]MBU1154044.1 Fe-S cluster assembly ATPase SufC [bacterium]MBU1781917.1 Fe-S cluster assembly ATPase SufC [bacterium]MBU2599387.1 Fe-S cluster assembly ATPase SufC [bacterium]